MAPNQGATQELITNKETGFIYENANDLAFKEIFKELLSDPQLKSFESVVFQFLPFMNMTWLSPLNAGWKKSLEVNNSIYCILLHHLF